jgi:hypothetical protein
MEGIATPIRRDLGDETRKSSTPGGPSSGGDCGPVQLLEGPRRATRRLRAGRPVNGTGIGSTDLDAESCKVHGSTRLRPATFPEVAVNHGPAATDGRLVTRLTYSRALAAPIPSELTRSSGSADKRRTRSPRAARRGTTAAVRPLRRPRSVRADAQRAGRLFPRAWAVTVRWRSGNRPPSRRSSPS